MELKIGSFLRLNRASINLIVKLAGMKDAKKMTKGRGIGTSIAAESGLRSHLDILLLFLVF